MKDFLTQLAGAFVGATVALFLLEHACGQMITCIQQPKSNLYYTDEQGQKTQAAEWSCKVEGREATTDEIRTAIWQVAPFTPNTVRRLGEWTKRKSPKHYWMTGLAIGGGLIGLGNWADIAEPELRAALGLASAGIPKLAQWIGTRPDAFIEATAPNPWHTIYGRAYPDRVFQARLGPPERAAPVEPPGVPDVAPLPSEGAPTLLFDPIRAYRPPVAIPVAWPAEMSLAEYRVLGGVALWRQRGD